MAMGLFASISFFFSAFSFVFSWFVDLSSLSRFSLAKIKSELAPSVLALARSGIQIKGEANKGKSLFLQKASPEFLKETRSFRDGIWSISVRKRALFDSQMMALELYPINKPAGTTLVCFGSEAWVLRVACC